MIPAGPEALVVMILRDEAEAPKLEEVAAQLRGLFGDLGSVRLDVVQQAVELCLGDDEVVVIPRSEPVPAQLLEGPCSEAWYWPDAAGILSQHRSHVAIVCRPSASSGVHRASFLTRVVAHLVAVHKGTGVYWDSATMVHSADVVLEAANEMTPTRLPVRLWVHFRIVAEPEGAGGIGTKSLFTTGLDAFSEREIEIWGSSANPQDMMAWSYNTAHYLIADKATLENGQAIAIDQARFVHVFIKPSMFDSTREIYCLVLEN